MVFEFVSHHQKQELNLFQNYHQNSQSTLKTKVINGIQRFNKEHEIQSHLSALLYFMQSH